MALSQLWSCAEISLTTISNEHHPISSAAHHPAIANRLKTQARSYAGSNPYSGDEVCLLKACGHLVLAFPTSFRQAVLARLTQSLTLTQAIQVERCCPRGG